jgi:ABC-type transport system involved in cytochrome c biogenesis ATPase subunit
MAVTVFLQKRIHEWSKTLPDWQRDLLRRLAKGPLADSDKAEVRAILIGVANAPGAVPLEFADLPVDENEHGCVELRTLGCFRNINCLAEDQTLPLHPGLNVIFGANGTGKTGHGRLLRGVCRAAEREDVLPNVFKPANASKSQTAELTIAVDGIERPVSIDLAKTPERILSAISVFDASCARVFLTKPNTIDYVPRPLIILKSLAEAQDAIATDLRSEAATMRSALTPLPEIDPATKAGEAVAAFNARTDIAVLEAFAQMSEDELLELGQLETAAAVIRADKSAELETAARTLAARTATAAATIREAALFVDDDVLDRLRRVREQLDATTAAEREIADKAFSGLRFPGAGQDKWREMWLAVKRYVEAGGATFPTNAAGAACPLCEQELDMDAAARFAAFEQFVRSDLRDRANVLTKELHGLVHSLPDTSALTVTVRSELRDAPEEVLLAAETALTALEARTARAVQHGATEPDEELTPLQTIDLGGLDEYAAEQTRVAETQASLRDPVKQAELLAMLAELEARQQLHTYLPKLKKRLAELKKIAICEGAGTKLGTQGISVQLRKLQEAVITERLRNMIGEELKGLSPLADQVELAGQVAKGETMIQLRLRDGCKERIDRVLSTGEQGAVATAFFLAELAVSEGRSAIVLDDPVSSLDHDNREYLATRLVHESTRRQVVIYTHDLTFLVYLQEAAATRGVSVHGQTLERSLDETGIVRDGLPTKTMSPSARRKELRRQLSFELTPMFNGQKSEYERAADLWVTDLRKGYDQVIEDYVLAGTVRRYHKHVRVKQLFQVTWTPEIAERIEQAMKEASPKSHFEALELYPRACTPDELTAMLEEFDAICELTVPKSGKEDALNKATIDDELVGQAQAAGASRAS